MKNGFKAMVSFDFEKGCSYAYFKTEEEAKNWAESEQKLWKDILKVEQKIQIEPIELKECAMIGCTNLIPIEESICLKCETIQADIVIEARNNALSEEVEQIIEEDIDEEW